MLGINRENRPWGFFEVLIDGEDGKTKILTVNPKGRLSYQYHQFRAEHWIVLSGTATITLDDVVTVHEKGSEIFIPALCKHRVENCSDQILEIFESQSGTYFGEDDIVRISDDYGR